MWERINGFASIKYLGSVVLSAIVWIFGGWHYMLTALFSLIVLDIIAGILHALYDRRFDSREIRLGAMRKAMYLVLVALGAGLDRSVFHDAPFSRSLLCGVLIVAEASSILEHAAGMNIPGVSTVKRFIIESAGKRMNLKEEEDEETS